MGTVRFTQVEASVRREDTDTGVSVMGTPNDVLRPEWAMQLMRAIGKALRVEAWVSVNVSRRGDRVKLYVKRGDMVSNEWYDTPDDVDALCDALDQMFVDMFSPKAAQGVKVPKDMQLVSKKEARRQVDSLLALQAEIDALKAGQLPLPG